jgi:hypothetical protein
MTPRLWIYAGAVGLAGAAWWAHEWHAGRVIDRAVQVERQAWQDQHRRALADANLQAQRLTTQAAMAALEAQIETAQLRESVARDRAVSAARLDGLQRTISAFRDRAARAPDAATPGSMAHGAATSADALSECADRYASVAGVADRLAVQVTGLQSYVRDVVGPVCIAMPEAQ